MPSCIISRVPDTHVWPEATNEAKAAPLTAATGSASSKMDDWSLKIRVNAQTTGGQPRRTFPPSSAVKDARLEPTMLPHYNVQFVYPPMRIRWFLGITIFKCLTVTSTFRIKGLLMIAFPSSFAQNQEAQLKHQQATGSLDHKFSHHNTPCKFLPPASSAHFGKLKNSNRCPLHGLVSGMSNCA